MAITLIRASALLISCAFVASASLPMVAAPAGVDAKPSAKAQPPAGVSVHLPSRRPANELEDDDEELRENGAASQAPREFPTVEQLEDAVAKARASHDLLAAALLFSFPGATKFLQKPASSVQATKAWAVVQDLDALVSTLPPSEDTAFCLAMIAHFDNVTGRNDQAESNYKKSIEQFRGAKSHGLFPLEFRDVYTRRSYSHGQERCKIGLALLYCKEKKIPQAEQIYKELMAPFYKYLWLPFGHESKTSYASQLDGNNGAALSALAAALGQAYDEQGQLDKAAEKFNDLLAFNESFEQRQLSESHEPEGKPSLAWALGFFSASGPAAFRHNDEAIIGAYMPLDEQMASYLVFDSKHHAMCKQADLNAIRARIEYLKGVRLARARREKLRNWRAEDTDAIGLLGTQPKVALQHIRDQIKARKAECISDPDLLQSLNLLSYQLIKYGYYSDADPLLKEAIALGTKAGKPVLAALGNTYSNLGLLDLEQGKLAEAKPLIEKALLLRADDSSDAFAVAKSRIVFGRLLAALGKQALAEGQLEDAARALSRHHYPLGPPDQGHAMDDPEAYMADRDVEEKVQTAAALYHVVALIELSAVYTTGGKYEAANQTLQLALKSKGFSLDPGFAPRAYEKLGRLALAKGALGESKTYLTRAESLAAKCNATRPVYVDLYSALGEFNKAAGKKKEAQSYYGKAATLLTDLLGPNNPRVIAMRKLERVQQSD